MFSIPGWPSKKIFPRATGILEFTPACPSPGLTISICYLCLKPKPTAWPLLCLQNIFTDFYSYKKKKKMFFLSSHSQEKESPGPDSELDSSWRRPLCGRLQRKGLSVCSLTLSGG